MSIEIKTLPSSLRGVSEQARSDRELEFISVSRGDGFEERFRASDSRIQWEERPFDPLGAEQLLGRTLSWGETVRELLGRVIGDRDDPCVVHISTRQVEEDTRRFVDGDLPPREVSNTLENLFRVGVLHLSYLHDPERGFGGYYTLSPYDDVRSAINIAPSSDPSNDPIVKRFIDACDRKGPLTLRALLMYFNAGASYKSEGTLMGTNAAWGYREREAIADSVDKAVRLGLLERSYNDPLRYTAHGYRLSERGLLLLEALGE